MRFCQLNFLLGVEIQENVLNKNIITHQITVKFLVSLAVTSSQYSKTMITNLPSNAWWGLYINIDCIVNRIIVHFIELT
jgi:hypothetical protein